MEFTSTIKQNYEFRRLYSKGKSCANADLVVYCRKNRAGRSRIGYTVSNKVGHAVVRNRIRRRVYEVVRLEEPTLKSGYDMALMVFSAEVYSLDHPSLVKLVKQLFSQAGLYK